MMLARTFGQPALGLVGLPATVHIADTVGADVLPAHHPIILPELYGHLEGRTLGLFLAAGWRAHRVGAACYLHDPSGTFRWIVGTWEAVRPPWADELDAYHRCARGRGAVPPRWRPRVRAREARYWRARRMARIRDRRTGRYVGRPQWWQELDGTPQAGFERPWRAA